MLPTLIWHLDMAPDRRSNADIRVPWSPRPTLSRWLLTRCLPLEQFRCRNL